MESSSRRDEILEKSFSASMPNPKIAHSALQITLSGPSLILTIVGLISSLYLFDAPFTATIIALAPLPVIITNDFKAFLSLGPGGTPSTFTGYLKITCLRLCALSDPFTPPVIPNPSTLFPLHGSFEALPSWLPHRSGPRPTVSGIAPQRQLDQYGCPEIYQHFRSTLIVGASRNPRLRTGTSCFEKQGLALFAMNSVNNTCNGEICHVHASDKSLHLNLHPEDARVVLERGWGQRHPLADGGWLGRYVPREFMMVYAPRNEEEMEVVVRIVEAAGWWVSGEKVELARLGKAEVFELDPAVAEAQQCPMPSALR